MDVVGQQQHFYTVTKKERKKNMQVLQLLGEDAMFPGGFPLDLSTYLRGLYLRGSI